MVASDRLRPVSLLSFHRPKINLHDAPIPELSKESKACLRRLAKYRLPKSKLSFVKFPRSRCAAVLVALFVGRQGDLYVLLSRRSASLRTYSGDTALPGGKVDDADRTMEDTARREAFEEIGLPKDRNKVPLLCILEPFLASNQTIVTPVVVLILDNTLRPMLNSAEVESLFSHPLASFLSASPPFPAAPEYLHVAYHSFVDSPWPPLSRLAPTTEWQSDEDSDDKSSLSGRRAKPRKSSPKASVGKIRFHRFLTGREAGGVKPIFGLTAAILIHTAMIGYDRQPDFDLNPPAEGHNPIEDTYLSDPKTPTTHVFTPSTEQRIAHAMCTVPAFKESYEKEGLKVDWDLIRRVAAGKGRDSSRL